MWNGSGLPEPAPRSKGVCGSVGSRHAIRLGGAGREATWDQRMGDRGPDDDRHLRRGHRRPPMDPRGCRTGKTRDARRQDDRARVSHAVAAAAHVAHDLAIRKRTRGLNYGLNKVRFTAAVPAGSRIRLHQSLKAAEPVEGGQRFTFEARIEVEGESRPALIAETLAIVYE